MDRLFQYLTELSGNASYLIIFGILVACGLGFPLPEDIPLIATGYLIWDGTMTWAGGLAVTLLGVVLGDTVLYFVGRKLGLRILDKKKGGLFSEKRVRRSRAYFRKYGDKVVFYARFFAGLRAVVFFMAGAMHMPYRKFILLDGLAALISVPVWIIIGFQLGKFFGANLAEFLARFKEIKTGFTIIIGLVVVIIIVRSVLKYRQNKKARKRTASIS